MIHIWRSRKQVVAEREGLFSPERGIAGGPNPKLQTPNPNPNPKRSLPLPLSPSPSPSLTHTSLSC